MGTQGRAERGKSESDALWVTMPIKCDSKDLDESVAITKREDRAYAVLGCLVYVRYIDDFGWFSSLPMGGFCHIYLFNFEVVLGL